MIEPTRLIWCLSFSTPLNQPTAMETKMVNIYTEATPNPETMKFVLNKMLFAHRSADFPTAESANGISPLATALFQQFPFVNGVFVMNNFITVTKQPQLEWYELIPELSTFIRQYIGNGGEIVDDALFDEMMEANETAQSEQTDENDGETVKKIKEVLQKYVQPAVEMDGGTIVFRQFTNGIVTLGMQGSCSGCPSSTVTLKAGIEGLLKRMVPEVELVEAEML